MTSIKSWIEALRPRTLFLAIAVTLCGNAIAYSNNKLSWPITLLTIVLSIMLQLLSNLANDYGDFSHGTDISGERIGPKRALQSGKISPSAMKRGIYTTAFISALIGLTLLVVAFKYLTLHQLIIFLVLGLACIWAAIKYTAGKNPYGYSGFGDLFSFLFFGPVAIIGTCFLQEHSFSFQPIMPSISFGLFTAAVLNINNMRDIENDRKSQKKTIPVTIGIKRAKIYHALLTIIAILSLIFYGITYLSYSYQWLFTIAFIPLLIILIKIIKTSKLKDLDPYLKFTALSTFFLSILFTIFINF